MLQLHKADGSGDGAAPAIAIRREDYTAPAYWIDSVELTFDLDPGEGVTWRALAEAAELVRVLLTGLGLEPFLKTSGGNGLHVVVPLRRGHDWDGCKTFARTVGEHLARTIPERFVAVTRSNCPIAYRGESDGIDSMMSP